MKNLKLIVYLIVFSFLVSGCQTIKQKTDKIVEDKPEPVVSDMPMGSKPITAPQTAFSFSDPVPINQAEITGLANIGGVPAISLPCGISASGLPLSFQLMARPYGEHDLLNAAESLEGIWGRFSLQHS